MKTFTDSYGLPADVDKTISLITTEQYVTAKYQALGAEGLRVNVLEDSDDKFHAEITRIVRLRDRVPSFAKKLFKEEMEIRHETWWNKKGDNKTGGFKAQLSGVSGGVDADLYLEQGEDGQAQIRIDGKVNVNIPLIGGKLEKLMAESAAEKFREDIAETSRYIEDRV